MSKPDVRMLLDALTANAEESKRLEDQLKRDAKRYADGESQGDLGKFLDYLPHLSKLLKAALGALEFYNDYTEEYNGAAPLDQGEAKQALQNCLAELDRRRVALRAERNRMMAVMPKTTKRRGRPATPADSKEYEERLVTAVLRDSSSTFPTRAAARHRVRKHLRAKGLRR